MKSRLMTTVKTFFLYLHYSKIHTGISNEVLKVFNNFSNEYFDNHELKLWKDTQNYFIMQRIYLESVMKKID